MKYLILIFLASFSAHANWITDSDFDLAKSNNNGATIHSSKKTCIGLCYDLNQCKLLNSIKIDLRKCMKGFVDNLEAPNLRATEDSPIKIDCLDYNDCQTKAFDPNGDLDQSDHVCLSDISSQERWDDLSNWAGITGVTGPWFIWCEKEDGTYQQKPALVIDTAGTTQANLDDGIKAAKDSEEANIQAVKKKMECGRSAIALMVIRNVPKNLTRAQKKTMKETYRDTKEFLELGALQEAKEELEASTPDGVIVTDADKVAIIAKIDECLAQ